MNPDEWLEEPKEDVPGEGDLVYGQGDTVDIRAPIIEQILLDMPEKQLFWKPSSGLLVQAVELREAPRSPLESEPANWTAADDCRMVLKQTNKIHLQRAVNDSRRVWKKARNGFERIDTSQSDMEHIMDRADFGESCQRPLQMLSDVPVLFPDGKIVCENGYYEEHRILVFTHSQWSDPDPEELLSVDECRRLFEQHLLPPFRLYPFTKDAAHPAQKFHETPAFATALDGAMGIALRNLLRVVPGHCVSSPQPGCGKTILAQAISALSRGFIPRNVSYKGKEDFEKHLTGLLIRGDPMILLNNITEAVISETLSQAMSDEGGITFRPFHSNTESMVIHCQSNFFFTGNNMKFDTDMETRCLLTEIQPDCDRPESKSYPFNPVDEARRLHPQALMTMLRVARAHMRRGFPGLKMLEKPMREFKDNDRWVRAPLLAMGFADPVETQEAIRGNNPFREANSQIVDMLEAAFGTQSFLVREIATKLSPNKGHNTDLDCYTLEDFMSLTGHKPDEEFNVLKAASALDKVQKQRFGGAFLQKLPRVSGKVKWQIVRPKESHDKKEKH